MTTPEGFKEAVEKAAEMFPEVNGEKLIPVGSHVFDNQGNVSFDKYLMNFLAVPWEKDGKYYDRYTDPEYVIWLKMFRELGEEGLLANDIFTYQKRLIGYDVIMLFHLFWCNRGERMQSLKRLQRRQE